METLTENPGPPSWGLDQWANNPLSVKTQNVKNFARLDVLRNAGCGKGRRNHASKKKKKKNWKRK